MKLVNKLKIYRFKIQAQAPVYFGSDKMGELVKDSEGVPILLGNSIGGALRSFLSEKEEIKEIVETYMGGSTQDDFVESRIY